MATYKLPKGVVQLGYIAAAYSLAPLRTLAPIVPALRAFGQVAGLLCVPPIPRAIWGGAAKIPLFRETVFATILDAAADRRRVPRGDYCGIALSLAKERHRGRSRKSSNRFYGRRGHPGATLPLTDQELLAFEADRLRLLSWQYWQLAFLLELERRRVPDRPLSEIRTRQGPVRR